MLDFSKSSFCFVPSIDKYLTSLYTEHCIILTTSLNRAALDYTSIPSTVESLPCKVQYLLPLV